MADEANEAYSVKGRNPVDMGGGRGSHPAQRPPVPPLQQHTIQNMQGGIQGGSPTSQRDPLGGYNPENPEHVALEQQMTSEGMGPMSHHSSQLPPRSAAHKKRRIIRSRARAQQPAEWNDGVTNSAIPEYRAYND